jgi:hypothetical protein
VVSKYHISFIYTEKTKDGETVLRSKQRVVEAKSMNDAVDRLKKEFGEPLRITSCHKEG